MKIKFNRNFIKKYIFKTILVILGTFIVAFGASVFLVPFDINNGGVSGLALVLDNFIPLDIDILVTIITWVLFFVGLLFLGFSFSIQTLVSSIFYPIFMSIILRSGIGEYLVKLLINDGMSIDSSSSVLVINGLENFQSGRLILVGLLGGSCYGLGCGITYIGGGSTGGLDNIAFILNKYLGLKQSIAVFIIDFVVIFSGIITHLVNNNSYGFLASLVGIFSATMCSVLIEYIYSKQNGAYFADVITDNVDELKDRVINELDRSVTIFEVTGGYSNEAKKCVRIIFSRNELSQIKDWVAEIDPKAFLVIGDCSTVNGEGFKPLKSSKENNTIDDIKKIKDIMNKDDK